MPRKIKLTDARIGKLKAGDVEYMVWDTRIAGFGVRVRPTGHKSYVYHRHAESQSRKFTLAQFVNCMRHLVTAAARQARSLAPGARPTRWNQLR